MTELHPAHPLDVDLADLAHGVLEADRSASLESHLASCRLCRMKRARLAEAGPAPPPAGRLPPPPRFLVPPGPDRPGGVPEAGELWRAGPGERLLVLVLQAEGPRVKVAPVTLDVEAADDETVVVGPDGSPLGTGLAVYLRLAADVPRSMLHDRVGRFSPDELPGVLAATLPNTGRGAAITGASDPRLDVRQHLADRLASLAEPAPHPGAVAGPGAADTDELRSSLMADLRSLRGDTCAVRPLYDWGDVVLADRAGWEPLVTVDEVGIVLVVLETPHGLAGDDDFNVARAVLTRSNATALVVLARALSDLADVFDSPSLNHGIAVPSGGHAPPNPLISGLSPFDAVSKYLDQTTGARAAAPPVREPIARVDVRGILRQAAAAAIEEAQRQGSRFKIAPKRRGYESVGDSTDLLRRALEDAFDGESPIESLLGPDHEPGP
jgi:hypothetical protein